MYKKLLETLSARPAVYEWGGSKFWNDEHISRGMLATHLDPEDDLATRKPGFVKASADWIATLAEGGYSIPGAAPAYMRRCSRRGV